MKESTAAQYLALWKLAALAMIIMVVACKKDSGVPPPVSHGKCRVMTYERDVATHSYCVFEGDLWSCDVDSCKRRGEATGEAIPERVDAPTIDAMTSDAKTVDAASDAP